MKKLLLIVGIVVGVILFSLCGVSYWYYGKSHTLTVLTASMSPKFPVGSKIEYVEENPVVGDYLVFKCLSDKCKMEGSKTYNTNTEFKQITELNNGNYWLRGLNSEFPCDYDSSKTCYSLDSRYYGFIGEPDIQILGVVK